MELGTIHPNLLRILLIGLLLKPQSMPKLARAGMIGVSCVTVAATGCGAASGQSSRSATHAGDVRPPANDERQATDPVISPRRGTPKTSFQIRLTLRANLGRQDGTLTAYEVFTSGVSRVSPAPGCTAGLPASLSEGRPGQRKRLWLRPAGRGWCQGDYRARLVVVRGRPCSGDLSAVCGNARRIAYGGEVMWQVSK
jgi:hypothetical protein